MADGSIERASGGRYRVLEPLGAGSTAEAFLVEDTATGARRVGKAYRLARAVDWKAWELVERGVRVAAGLAHPGIPRIHEVLRPEGGTVWVVEEYVPGRSLRALVAEAGPLGVRRSVGIARGVLDALDYLHRRQPPLVHRDVKPSNILVRPDGRVALIDFGAVREALQEGGSTVVGTFGYMPPEQYMGRAAPASDLYAMGATLLFMLTGREPADFPVRDMRLDVRAALGERPRLARVLEGLMEPRVERRVATAREASRALGALLAPERRTAAASPAGGPAPLPEALARLVERFAPDEPVRVLDAPRRLACPACAAPMDAAPGGAGAEGLRCSGCGGVWLERGAPKGGQRAAPATRRAAERVVYRRCPVCDEMMNRVGLAHGGGVIVDACGGHGLFLDAGEVALLRAGSQQRPDPGRDA